MQGPSVETEGGENIMAVENKWIDANVEAGLKGNPAIVAGAKVMCLAGTFEVAVGDSNGSIYKLGRLPANAIPVRAEIFADAAIDSTDADLGLYKGSDGVVADKDLFADGLDLNAGAAITAPKDGLTNLGGADPLTALGKKLYELLGLTIVTKTEEDYILALTLNVAGGAAGTIGYRFWYVVG